MADLIMRLPVPYESKRTNRWLVRIKNERSSNKTKVQEWVMKSTTRPIFKRTKWWNFWKKFEVDTIEIVMDDPIGPSTTQIINDFVINDSVLDYDLEMLDPTGVCVEKWKVTKCKILKVDFGSLTYKEDKAVTCTLLLKPKSAKLVF